MNKPAAIILRGTGNCGKTETLNLLIDLIDDCPDFSAVKIEPINFDRQGKAKDRRCTAEFAGRKIAITTQGDHPSELEAWYKLCCRDACVCVFPCRIRGAFSFIERYFDQSRLIWHGKWYVNDDIAFVKTESEQIKSFRESANRFQADVFFDALKLMITK